MIGDIIFDRMGGVGYTAEDFKAIKTYARVWKHKAITKAVRAKNEADLKAALCEYIDINEFGSQAMKDFVNKVNWII